jgi:hypothetical protein
MSVTQKVLVEQPAGADDILEALSDSCIVILMHRIICFVLASIAM